MHKTNKFLGSDKGLDGIKETSNDSVIMTAQAAAAESMGKTATLEAQPATLTDLLQRTTLPLHVYY
jgi:hypothetical protein